LNKSKTAQFSLICSDQIHERCNLVLIQEPYLNQYKNTKATSKWVVVYLYARNSSEHWSTVCLVILVNVQLGTNSWSQLPIPKSLDLGAITLWCGLGDLTVLNVYNTGDNMTTMDLLHKL
ncbi:hypothetical protein BDV98DRAFT_483421, partial [Pterulicium gracile]